MQDDKDKKQERKDEEQSQPQHEPPRSPTGTLYNNPSVSTANPVAGQAQIVNFLQGVQSMNYQKEPNPEIVNIAGPYTALYADRKSRFHPFSISLSLASYFFHVHLSFRNEFCRQITPSKDRH